jgi:hypothetical protein
MKKAEKKARKGRKSRTRATSKESMRRLWEDPDSLVWSPASIAMNCVARSNSATAWLLRDVYSAYYRTAHHFDAMHRAAGTAGSRAAIPMMKQAFEESVFAFSGSGALPELADAVRGTVLEALGVRGRPGIAVGAVYGWLAEHLPADEAMPYRNADWEALAGRLAEQAMAKAEPAFVDAYRRLRDMTSRYPQVPDVMLAYTDASNAQCGLPSFVPEGKVARAAFLNEELSGCWDLLVSCMRLRPKFADMLHRLVGDAVWKLVLPVAELEGIAEGDFFVWFHKEAELDAALMLKEFVERFEQSGRGFEVFYAYWNRVGVMLRDYTATKVEMVDFYRRRLRQVFDEIEKRRVVPEGTW